MKKSLLEIYALAICFVTIISFSIVLGIGTYDILEMTNPEMTLKSHQYQRHQTNEAFIRRWPSNKEKPSQSEITQMREKSYRVAIDAERRDAIQSLYRVVIIMVISCVIFLAHWKLSKKSREAGVI